MEVTRTYKPPQGTAWKLIEYPDIDEVEEWLLHKYPNAGVHVPKYKVVVTGLFPRRCLTSSKKGTSDLGKPCVWILLLAADAQTLSEVSIAMEH